MAAALGPPEVIAQLENAAKVLMVSRRAAPRPPRPTRPRRARRARRAARRASRGAERRRRRGAGVPILGLRPACRCGRGTGSPGPGGPSAPARSPGAGPGAGASAGPCARRRTRGRDRGVAQPAAGSSLRVPERVLRPRGNRGGGTWEGGLWDQGHRPNFARSPRGRALPSCRRDGRAGLTSGGIRREREEDGASEGAPRGDWGSDGLDAAAP